MKRTRQTPTAANRPGFTLVELLVTFAIIAVLGALLAAGVMGWMSSQARRNTETEIRTLHNALLQHWDVVVKDAKDDKSVPPAVLDFAGNDPKLARVIWIKLRLMEAFPISFDEIAKASIVPKASRPAPWNLIPDDKRRYSSSYADQLKSRVAAKTVAKTQSAACLLLAINVNRNGVSHSVDLLRPFTRDTDGDGIIELADGWGEPLYFYRFPAGSDELQSSRPSTMVLPKLDPLDPNGLLFAWNGGNSATFDAKFHTRRKSVSEAWYPIPTILSSGPDLSLPLIDKDGVTKIAVNLPSVPETLPSILPDDTIASFKLK